MTTDPTERRIRRHAERTLAHLETLDPAIRLKSLKDFLTLENSLLQRHHSRGASGLKITRARSVVIDCIITALVDAALASHREAHGKQPMPVAVLALGGYGRAELCPFSDVDIMFLYPRKAPPKLLQPFQSSLSDGVLYPLWDLNLKIGHSSRTLNEALDEARKDILTKNALLEARLICGDTGLYAQFTQQFRSFYAKDSPREYVKTRMKDQGERRARYGNTVFLQEPDIKNGVGGLRDYQNILWLARICLDAETLDQLVERRLLDKNDQRDLIKAYDFLLRVRNELHFQSSRATDLLDLERQPRIAWRLGYTKRDVFKRVEVFMRDYYRHARFIFRTSRILERQIALDGRTKGGPITFRAVLAAHRVRRRRHIDGFTLIDDILYHDSPKVFQQEPERLVRVFRHAQQYEAELSLELNVLIRQSLHLITDKVVRSPSANRAFRAILQTAGQVYPALMAMHEAGVLGRFIPEFGTLDCLVQHEFYHRYTVDIHTLETIRELDRVFASEGEFASRYREQLHETSIPTLLYLILLLHDIGKAHGVQGHANASREMALPLLQRMEIEPRIAETILLIIQNHLEMARFWQRFDVEDTRTAAALARLVGDSEHLRYLYVHTYCDARGTAEGLWNSYKDMLHNRLFQTTLEQFGTENTSRKSGKEQKKTMFTQIKALKPQGVSDEEIEAHFNLLPERYFVQYGKDEVALHLAMVNQLLTTISQADSLGSLVPVIDWRDDLDQSLTVVTVVTWDRAGLFYKLAGAFSLAGLNILSTKAISRSDHITIDTFYIVESGGGVVQNKKTREIFERHISQALLHNKDMMVEINAMADKRARSSYALHRERPAVPIPTTIDVYHELNLRRTIIEVQTNDQIGLLYRIAKIIFDHGFDITFARIATERGVALDTFYIENIHDEEDENTDNLVKLRDSLNAALHIPSEQAAAV